MSVRHLPRLKGAPLLCARSLVWNADDVSRGALQQSTLPFHLGGLGLASAVRTRDGAYWASWADAVSTIHKKDPDLATTILAGLHSEGEGCFAVANLCAERLVALGVELPTWDAVVAGATPDHIHNTPVEEPRVHRGWQQHVSNTVEKVFNTEAVWPSLDANERALALSQSGPLAGVPFHCFPTSYATRMDSEIFRTLLLRRLRLPLPLNARVCRCGRLPDSLGNHRSACAVSGALVRRGFEVEVAVARICREGGARVSTNVMVRDLDLSQAPGVDGRRFEVVAEGLSLFGGAQLAIDATLVSALHGDGTARAGSATRPGAALVVARRRKERTYPELAGEGGRARLVVLAGEVGGQPKQPVS